MVFGCWFYVFVVLINKVSLQETVQREAVIGGSVDLPCFSTQPHLNPQEVNVHWRHNGSEIVYDIIKGEDSLVFQDPRYKNRAETFREDYQRGNFSIKLNKIQYTDAGEFGCIITESSEPQTVQLIIKESTAEKESKSTVQENQDEETESDSVETSSYWIPIVIIIVLLSIILSILLSVVFYCKRKKQGSSFSSVSAQMTG